MLIVAVAAASVPGWRATRVDPNVALREERRNMTKLLGLIGASVAGWIGWYLAAPFGMVAAFIVSTIASGFGMYYAARWARNNLG